MDIIDLFKNYLSGEKKVSKVTVKNYSSDLNKFINWFKSTYNRSFDLLDFTPETLNDFVDSTSVGSVRSQERYLSTLRKFAAFLFTKGYLKANPFDNLKKDQNVSEDTDPWKLRGFRDFLYVNDAKRSTIKNYLVDINAFTAWLEKATTNRGISSSNLITSDIINLYKERLMSVLGMSPKSVNRKLSSIRRYLEYAKQHAPVPEISIPNVEVIERMDSKNGLNLKLEDFTMASELPEGEFTDNLSSIPPVRLVQRIASPYVSLEEKTASKIADVIHKRRLEKKALALEQQKSAKFVRNIPKLMYAPREVSVASLNGKEKLLYHLRFTRPKWYKTYHSYTFTSYLHLSVLVIYASLIGFLIYNGLFESGDKAFAVASPPRTLSFQGRLTDSGNSPITEPTRLRFQIYNDSSATGAGALLWQEASMVVPDENGVFSHLLGNGVTCGGQPLTPQVRSCAFPSGLFADNQKLYLGITIENTEELTPRQQIASVAYASNSETLQGMRPISETGAGQRNVILNLDSSGNLTIGGSANPSFSATGGTFKLSGQTLLLTTNPASNSNVVIEPDGLGNVDIRRPLVNTGTGGATVPGAVEVHDTFAVIATESARAAFIVNNNTTGGNIFVASSSGTARFILENNGDIDLQPGVSIDTISTGTLLIGNTTASTITIGRTGNGITLPEFAEQNGVLYGSYGTGELNQATTSSSGLCLLSGSSSPTWGSCPGSSVVESYLGVANGVLYSGNSTLDFAIGGSSTSSADFAVFNVNGTGPVTATLSGNLIVMPRNGAAGNLGVGTANPQTRAHIQGGSDGNILRLEDSDGACDHNPEAGSEVVTCSSDERLKSNIADAESTLPELMNYRIRSYTVNKSGDLSTGVIAQEVAQIYPDKVKIGPDGYLMVEQPNPWVIIKGMQELFSKIENITARMGGTALETLSATDESVTTAGEHLREYIARIVNEVLDSRPASPVIESERISTDTITPLTESSDISLSLEDSKFEVKSASGNVASIDSSGNASFSGTLAASSASISGSLSTESLTSSDASISGTLYAGKIQAGSIEGLDEKIAYATQVLSASSASAIFDIDEILNRQIALGNFLDLKTLSADFGTFREGLIALGPATFSQVTVLDSFSIGTNFIFGQNSIDTLGMDLEIQPLKQGAVSILAGAVRIETDGTLRVRGNAEIAGNLKVGGKVETNIISPLAGQDLIVEGSGSAVLAVNKTGDVISSGSATFNKFNLSFVSPAYAVSDTEVVSTSAAGLASIKPYRTEMTIYNPFVTEESLIYITPVGRTYNQVLYMMRQVPGKSFTVGIDAPVSREVQFNYIIVN